MSVGRLLEFVGAEEQKHIHRKQFQFEQCQAMVSMMISAYATRHVQTEHYVDTLAS
jgi:hypothetical protein